MLRSNTSLNVLETADNEIGDRGAEAIAAVLKNNTTLHTLNLSYNKISDKGATFLENALRSNTTLQVLAFQGNPIKVQIKFALAKSLKFNQDLMLIKQSHHLLHLPQCAQVLEQLYLLQMDPNSKLYFFPTELIHSISHILYLLWSVKE